MLQKCLDEEDESVVPNFDVHQAEEYYKKIYSAGPNCFSQPHWLPSPPSPSVLFNTNKITVAEIAQVIKRSKSRAAANPLHGISYKNIKRCPSLLLALSNLFNLCWESAIVPHAWKQPVVRLIPKTSPYLCSSDPVNFRPIALTFCVGKLFLSILKNKWLPFMLKKSIHEYQHPKSIH